VGNLLKDFAPTENPESTPQPLDMWILSKAEKLTEKVTDALEKCQFNIALEETRNFTWHVFCDCYIEAVKDRLYKPEIYGQEKRRAAQYTLYTVLHRILQLLAPVIPHVTEEIFQIMYAEEKGYKSLHLSPWPSFDKKRIDEEAEKRGDLIMAVITEARKEKAEKHLPLNTQIRKLTIYAGEEDAAEIVAQGREDISGTIKAANIEILSRKGEGRAINPYNIHFIAEY
jgi:valyl-tRNA synthetase